MGDSVYFPFQIEPVKDGGMDTPDLASNFDEVPASSPVATSDAGIQEEEINVPPAGALLIQYKRIKDLGTRLATWDSRVAHFFDPKANTPPVTLTPEMELKSRSKYMFAINRPLNLKNSDAYSISGKRKTKPTLLHCATHNDKTFFAVEFPEGDWQLDLEWEEPDVETTSIIAKKQPGTRYRSNVQAQLQVTIPISNNNLSEKEEQYIAECTPVLILIPKGNKQLQDSIEKDSLEKQDYVRIQTSNLFHKVVKPLKHYLVNTLVYSKDNQEELCEFLKYADNIIFFGVAKPALTGAVEITNHEAWLDLEIGSIISSAPVASSRYMVRTLTDENNVETKLRTPYLDPTEWPRESKSYRDITYESALVLSKIQELNKLSQCCALILPQYDSGVVQPSVLSTAITYGTEAPITPKLYLLWKFNGLQGKSESQYLHEVTQFVQSNSIPVILDDVCRGCVAVIMHGPAWAWNYLTALSSLIADTFGSDLRSITQLSCNNVVDLMRRKDNTQFLPVLTKLHTQMIHYQVPHIIKNKLSLVFMSSTKLLIEDRPKIELSPLDNSMKPHTEDPKLEDTDYMQIDNEKEDDEEQMIVTLNNHQDFGSAENKPTDPSSSLTLGPTAQHTHKRWAHAIIRLSSWHFVLRESPGLKFNKFASLAKCLRRAGVHYFDYNGKIIWEVGEKTSLDVHQILQLGPIDSPEEVFFPRNLTSSEVTKLDTLTAEGVALVNKKSFPAQFYLQHTQ